MQSIFQVGFSLADLFRDPLDLKSADPNSIQKLAAELDTQLDARAIAFKNTEAGVVTIDAEFQAVFDEADIRTRLLPSSVAEGDASQATTVETPEDAVFIDDAILKAIETGEISIDDLVAPGTPFHDHLKAVLSARLPTKAPAPAVSTQNEGSDAQRPTETLKHATDAPTPASLRSEIPATVLAPPTKIRGEATREAPALAPAKEKSPLRSPLKPTPERIRFTPGQPLVQAVSGTAPEPATDLTHLQVKTQGEERALPQGLSTLVEKTDTSLTAKTTPQTTKAPPDPAPVSTPLVITAQTGSQGLKPIGVKAGETLSPPLYSSGSSQPLTTREAASALLKPQTPATADRVGSPMAKPAHTIGLAAAPAQKVGVGIDQTIDQKHPPQINRQNTSKLQQIFVASADRETIPLVNQARLSTFGPRPASEASPEVSAGRLRGTPEQYRITNTPSPALKAADGPGPSPRTIKPTGMPVTVSYVPTAYPPATETTLKAHTPLSTVPLATEGPALVKHVSAAERNVGRIPATPAIDPQTPPRTPVDLLARPPVEPLAQTPVEPLAKTPVEPSARPSAEPLARTPLPATKDQVARTQYPLLQGTDRDRKSETIKLTPDQTRATQPAQKGVLPTQATPPPAIVAGPPASTIRVDTSMAYQASSDTIPSEPGLETAAREVRTASTVTPGAQLPTAPTAKAPPQHIAQQIAVAIQNRTSSTVEITLSPVELGNVRISLTSADTGMIVNIQAERPETLDLIRRNAEILAEDFRDLGYDGTSFSFEGSDQRKQSPNAKPEGVDHTAGDLQDAGVTAPSGPSPTPSPILSDGAVDIRI